MRVIELFLFGIAAVTDLALLLALSQRINRGRVAVWMKALTGGVAAVHVSIFARLMLENVSGPMATSVGRLLVVCMCGGLLVLPSAMLHAAARLRLTGLVACPRRDWRYLMLYAPVLVLPWIAVGLSGTAHDSFLVQLGPWVVWYLVWMPIANVSSIVLFLRLRGRIGSQRLDLFLVRLSIVIGVITCLCIAYAVVPAEHPTAAPLRLLATLSPLGAAWLFVWHLLRGRLLPLVMERTFAYGAILVGTLLIHRLVVAPFAGVLRAKTDIDFLMVEGIVAIFVILAVPTLRARVGEALRYLFSRNVFQIRDATRRLSLKISQNASLGTDELVQWFADELRQSIAIEHATILLNVTGAAAPHVVRSGQGMQPTCSDQPSTAMTIIHRACLNSNVAIERGTVDDNELDDALAAENVLIALPFAFRSASGTVLLGNRNRSDRLALEQVNALSLVVDQFAATLHNRHEEALRQRAERKILQQEKLSVLGLLSGSLAHDLRNPLSSIRTIATLVTEELGPDHPCRHDLQLITTEIDRLNQTSKRLLDFAKPEPDREQWISPDQITLRIVSVLEYLARQYHVETELRLNCCDTRISSNEASVSEIIFNLVKNAIEAVRDIGQGKVSIHSRLDNGHVIIAVHDNGPGIAKELRDKLFHPFVTFKPDGNGLGLYAAAERVRELGGSIEYRCSEPTGTSFEVRIPIARHDEDPNR